MFRCCVRSSGARHWSPIPNVFVCVRFCVCESERVVVCVCVCVCVREREREKERERVCVFMCQVERQRGSERDHGPAQTKNKRTHPRALTFLNRVASFWHTALQKRKKEKGIREKKKEKEKKKVHTRLQQIDR